MSHRARPTMPRKLMPSNRGTRSRAEAAIELVRLEYERERLVASIGSANATLMQLKDGLQSVESRIEQINDILVPAGRARKA